MRIVVTRPQRSGERTAAKLEALGHEPVLLPLFHPIHHGERAISALSAPLAAIAVTSAEALRALDTFEEQLAPHLSKPFLPSVEQQRKRRKIPASGRYSPPPEMPWV